MYILHISYEKPYNSLKQKKTTAYSQKRICNSTFNIGNTKSTSELKKNIRIK